MKLIVSIGVCIEDGMTGARAQLHLMRLGCLVGRLRCWKRSLSGSVIDFNRPNLLESSAPFLFLRSKYCFLTVKMIRNLLIFLSVFGGL
ncbi:MAG: hypothetical protein DID91_2727703500 [Candidatus Nitrotoga sp. MKT]|nr:MAG: hypothetical protein DID91_2727703500 [Candidatus Nitrotoga sp. MKT]